MREKPGSGKAIRHHSTTQAEGARVQSRSQHKNLCDYKILDIQGRKPNAVQRGRFPSRESGERVIGRGTEREGSKPPSN